MRFFTALCAGLCLYPVLAQAQTETTPAAPAQTLPETGLEIVLPVVNGIPWELDTQSRTNEGAARFDSLILPLPNGRLKAHLSVFAGGGACRFTLAQGVTVDTLELAPLPADVPGWAPEVRVGVETLGGKPLRFCADVAGHRVQLIAFAPELAAAFPSIAPLLAELRRAAVARYGEAQSEGGVRPLGDSGLSLSVRPGWLFQEESWGWVLAARTGPRAGFSVKLKARADGASCGSIIDAAANDAREIIELDDAWLPAQFERRGLRRGGADAVRAAVERGFYVHEACTQGPSWAAHVIVVTIMEPRLTRDDESEIAAMLGEIATTVRMQGAAAGTAAPTAAGTVDGTATYDSERETGLSANMVMAGYAYGSGAITYHVSPDAVLDTSGHLLYLDSHFSLLDIFVEPSAFELRDVWLAGLTLGSLSATSDEDDIFVATDRRYSDPGKMQGSAHFGAGISAAYAISRDLDLGGIVAIDAMRDNLALVGNDEDDADGAGLFAIGGFPAVVRVQPRVRYDSFELDLVASMPLLLLGARLTYRNDGGYDFFLGVERLAFDHQFLPAVGTAPKSGIDGSAMRFFLGVGSTFGSR